MVISIHQFTPDSVWVYCIDGRCTCIAPGAGSSASEPTLGGKKKKKKGRSLTGTSEIAVSATDDDDDDEEDDGQTTLLIFTSTSPEPYHLNITSSSPDLQLIFPVKPHLNLI